MTWNELKEFANSLNEEQLNKPVILWRESEAITDISAEALAEDHYIDLEEDEGCYPLSAVGLTVEEAEEKGFVLTHPKGFPILHEGF